jgi:hypothetical protein
LRTDRRKLRADLPGTVVAFSHPKRHILRAGDVETYSPQQGQGKFLTERVRFGRVEEVAREMIPAYALVKKAAARRSRTSLITR